MKVKLKVHITFEMESNTMYSNKNSTLQDIADKEARNLIYYPKLLKQCIDQPNNNFNLTTELINENN